MNWIFFVAAVAAFAFLVRRIDSLPRRLFDRLKALRAQEEGHAQAVVMEAAARKVGPLIAGIRTYHDQIAASLRAQLAAAELRARLSERREEDAATFLSAASKLIGELRALHDTGGYAAAVHARTSELAPEVVDPDQRATIEVPRPESGAVRVLPARSEQPPSTAPALRAAGLFPRPASGRFRSEPRGEHAREEPIEPTRDAPAPRVPAIDTGDSGDWLLSERPSDPEGERTRVGPQPLLLGPPSARAAAKSTLPSMTAVRVGAPEAAPVEAGAPHDTSSGGTLR